MSSQVAAHRRKVVGSRSRCRSGRPPAVSSPHGRRAADRVEGRGPETPRSAPPPLAAGVNRAWGRRRDRRRHHRQGGAGGAGHRRDGTVAIGLSGQELIVSGYVERAPSDTEPPHPILALPWSVVPSPVHGSSLIGPWREPRSAAKAPTTHAAGWRDARRLIGAVHCAPLRARSGAVEVQVLLPRPADRRQQRRPSRQPDALEHLLDHRGLRDRRDQSQSPLAPHALEYITLEYPAHQVCP